MAWHAGVSAAHHTGPVWSIIIRRAVAGLAAVIEYQMRVVRPDDPPKLNI